MAGRPPLLASNERRARVEAAAVLAFAELGYTAARIDDISVRSGVSKPAIYREYESKAGLYTAVIERFARDNAEAALAALMSTSGSADERLTAMIDAWFERVEANPETFRLSRRDAPDDPLVHDAMQRVHALQVANDVGLIRLLAPELPESEIEPLAEVVRGALLSLAAWWSQHPNVTRSVPVAVMVRLCRGVTLTTASGLAATVEEGTG